MGLVYRGRHVTDQTCKGQQFWFSSNLQKMQHLTSQKMQLTKWRCWLF